MDTSEKEFEETDVETGSVDMATTQTTTITVLQEQVDNLISQTEEADLELKT
jgi:hypothetical protein